MVSSLSASSNSTTGRKFDDAEVQADVKHFPFKVTNKGGKPQVQVEFKGEEKTFSPEEISSMILTKMRETAEAYLGGTVNNAVVTGRIIMILFVLVELTMNSPRVLQRFSAPSNQRCWSYCRYIPGPQLLYITNLHIHRS